MLFRGFDPFHERCDIEYPPWSLCISFYRRESDTQGSMSPFDFFQQEMLRPFEGTPPSLSYICVLSLNSFADFFGSNHFGFFENRFSANSPDNYFPSPPPNNSNMNPPHYSFQPEERSRRSQRKEDARKQERRDLQEIFDKYEGPEVEI